jgi:hypothetical protein
MPVQPGVGIVSDGPSADTTSTQYPAQITLLPGQNLGLGVPTARNVSLIGSNYGQQFASNISTVVGTDGVVPFTSAAAGFPFGTWLAPIGQPANNPYYLPTGVVNTSNAIVRGLFARAGLVPVWVGAVQGGTAVTIGSIVGKTAATGSSSYNFASVIAATNGQFIGTVNATARLTTLSAAVSAGTWSTSARQSRASRPSAPTSSGSPTRT